jgi:hypothetical protein
VKKSFGLTAALAAIMFAALFLPGCPTEAEDPNTGGYTGGDNTGDDNKGDDNKGDDNKGGDGTATAAMTWTGDWTKVSDTIYRSNAIGHSANTIERLNITASGAGTITIQITASSQAGNYSYYYGNYGDYGYASELDTGVSTSNYQMQVSGTQVATHTYAIPSGSHWIQFMYEKDSSDTSLNDQVTVEIISSSFASSSNTNPTTNTKLKVQNESSFTLADVKWGSKVVSASLAPSESTTVDVTDGTGYLYFTKGSAEGLKCRTQDVIAVVKDETTDQTITNNTVVVDLDDPTNIGPLETIAPRETKLTLSNQSFTELTEVIWNNVSFANNSVENSIKTGTSVSHTVSAGTGYIFFKRKSSPITARTKDLVIIAEYENKPFTFEDSTEIVEVNNQDNTGTLGALQSTVVFWDDAEGEMQAYYEKASFVGYYATYSDLLLYPYNNSNYYDTPKNGQKSIAVGGTNTAKLHIKITLSKAAKLSFWYANTCSSYNSGETSFSINGETKRTWPTDVNWSKVEYDLAAGVNDLVWEKTDGYFYFYYDYSYDHYYYLTLDDILIYYTE